MGSSAGVYTVSRASGMAGTCSSVAVKVSGPAVAWMKVRTRGSGSATSCRDHRSANSRLMPHSLRMSSSQSGSPTCRA